LIDSNTVVVARWCNGQRD